MIETLDSLPSVMVYAAIAIVLAIHTLLLSTRKSPYWSLLIPVIWTIFGIVSIATGNSVNIISVIIVLIGLLAFSGLGRGLRKSRIDQQDSKIDLRGHS